MINFYYEVSFTIQNTDEIQTWIKNVIVSENFKSGDISYIFCDDAYLLKKNIKYLKHNILTDIISFDYTMGKLISGDIFISVERVAENAKIFKTSITDELHRVMIHGVLHYCGYKDKTASEKATIRTKEDYYLSLRDF